MEHDTWFARYDQMKVQIQIWKVQHFKLLLLLDKGSQYEHVGKEPLDLDLWITRCEQKKFEYESE